MKKTVKSKIKAVHVALHKRMEEMEKPHGETYEATSIGFVHWCMDSNIRVPSMLWKDYCDIANLYEKLVGEEGAAAALGGAMEEIRSDYFNNIKAFLLDCASGVTRESVRNRGSLSREPMYLLLEAERNARTKLSPRRERLLEKYSRKPDEVVAIRREQEARRAAKLGKFLLSKGASAKGAAHGQKEEGL